MQKHGKRTALKACRVLSEAIEELQMDELLTETLGRTCYRPICSREGKGMG